MMTQYYVGGLLGFVVTTMMLLLILRFLFDALHINRYQPIVMQVYQSTRFIDSIFSGFKLLFRKKINIGVLLTIFVLETIYFMLVASSVEYGMAMTPITAFMSVLILVIDRFMAFFYYAMWALLILSWISLFTNNRSVFYDLVEQITQPILEPLNRLIPPIGPFSITLMIALFALHFIRVGLSQALSFWQVYGSTMFQ